MGYFFVESWEVSTTDGRGATHHLRNTLHLLLPQFAARSCLWYAEPNAIANAVSYAKFYSRPHDAVIRVYDEGRNVIDTHEQTLISCPGF
jgi:hypothetical protein